MAAISRVAIVAPRSLFRVTATSKRCITTANNRIDRAMENLFVLL